MKDVESKVLPVLEMSCAVCANNVEDTVKALPGVEEASVNFAANTLSVTYHPSVISLQKMQEAVQATGYDLVVEAEDPLAVQEEMARKHYKKLKRNTIGAWILSVPLALLGMVLFGRSFYVNGVRHALQKSANMDTLVAVSTGVAFLFSLFNTLWPTYWTDRGLEAHIYYEAAAVIIALILLGRLLESRAKSNTSTAIRKLIGLQINFRNG